MQLRDGRRRLLVRVELHEGDAAGPPCDMMVRVVVERNGSPRCWMV